MNEWMTTNEWMVKYVSIYQNAKHGQTIKKLNKWIRCAALQKEKYNTGFFKSYFYLTKILRLCFKRSVQPVDWSLYVFVNKQTHTFVK